MWIDQIIFSFPWQIEYFLLPFALIWIFLPLLHYSNLPPLRTGKKIELLSGKSQNHRAGVMRLQERTGYGRSFFFARMASLERRAGGNVERGEKTIRESIFASWRMEPSNRYQEGKLAPGCGHRRSGRSIRQEDRWI